MEQPRFSLDNIVFEKQTITSDALFYDKETGFRLYIESGRQVPLSEIIERFKKAAL